MENLTLEEILTEEIEQNVPEHQLRFSSASWYKYTKDVEVIIGGSGGIGRYICISHF